MRYLADHDAFLLSGEDGVLEVLRVNGHKVVSMADEANQMFA